MNFLNLNNDNFGYVRHLAYVAGIWPYHTSKERFFYGALIMISCFSVIFIPEIIAGIVYGDDPIVILELIVVFIMNIMSTTKFIANIYNHRTIRNLLDQAKKNLKACTSQDEYNILQNYTILGDKLAYAWSGVIFVATFFYATEPLMAPFLSYLLNYNHTAPLKFAVPLYMYGIDMEKYYYSIVCLIGILIFGLLNINVVSDAIFIALLEHASGLFAVTGHMMNNIPTKEDLKKGTISNNSLLTFEEIQYQHYVNCIKKHKRAIKFAGDLEATYVWCFGIVTLINVPLMSLTATQLTLQASNIQEVLKLTTFGVAQIIHLFFDCFLSQQLINSSLNVQESVITGKWYTTSPKVRKLITFITLRSQLPCKLTAGKVMTLSLDTFTSFMKTAGSYFTVLGSMQ